MSEAVRHLEQEYDSEVRFRAVVVSSERITPESSSEEVRELVLDVDRPDFPYRVGQSIGVLAPGAAEFGKSHHYRLYSVADLPERGEAGDPLDRVSAPQARFPLPISRAEEQRRARGSPVSPRSGLAREGALHTRLEDVGGLAARAGVGQLVLVRLRPPPVYAFQYRRLVAESYPGPVSVPDDGEELPLR